MRYATQLRGAEHASSCGDSLDVERRGDQRQSQDENASSTAASVLGNRASLGTSQLCCWLPRKDTDGCSHSATMGDRVWDD